MEERTTEAQRREEERIAKEPRKAGVESNRTFFLPGFLGSLAASLLRLCPSVVSILRALDESDGPPRFDTLLEIGAQLLHA
jgi:hypothetical protein